MVQWVVGKRSLDHFGIAHEKRTVQPFDRLFPSETGSNQFPTAGEPEHQMRLNKAKRNMEVTLHKASIDQHSRSGTGDAQLRMSTSVTSIVRHNRIVREN